MDVEYRDVRGFPGYRVGDDGSVWSRHVRGAGSARKADVWHRLKETKARRYLCVNLVKDTKKHKTLIHRIVLFAFVGPPEIDLQCRHLNGNGNDNRLSNLAWGTPKENCEDKDSHRTLLVGEGHPRAKLKMQEVEQILALSMIPRGELAIKYGVSVATIKSIRANRNWSTARKWKTDDAHREAFQ